MRTEALASLLLIIGLTCSCFSIIFFHHVADGVAFVDRETDTDTDTDTDTQAHTHTPHTTLIVGGTDGSGTRSVVYLLDKLGVPISADNMGTLDTSGHEIGGWPPTVRLLLNATRSADYELSDIPEDVRTEVISRIDNLWSSQLSRHRSQASAPRTKHSDVSWAFKAPVAMLLLPIFAEVARQREYGRIKFLHVVRDGRDIAYSGNQSPVTKFYNVSFPIKADDEEKEDARSRAIKLWSTWNTQVLSWCQRKVRRSTEFDFMVLHVEDLVSSNVETRRAAIASVGRFVGSTVGETGICCIAEQKKIDLGSHTKMELNRDPIESRYGKWKSLATPEALADLNKTGMAGLKAFGYEPWERPEEQISPSVSGSCDFEPCKDWVAPQSLLTRLSRLSRMKMRETMAEAFENKRRTRDYPAVGMQGFNARDRLYQARHPRYPRQNGTQDRQVSNKVREREEGMRRLHNKFRLHVPQVHVPGLAN